MDFKWSHTMSRDLLMSVCLDGKGIICQPIGPCSRKQFDCFVKRVTKMSIHDLTLQFKQMNSALASGQTWYDPNLAATVVDPLQVRWLRQVYGLMSRTHGMVDTQPHLEDWARRLHSCRSSVSGISRYAEGQYIVSLARRAIRAWLGPCPDLVTMLPKHGPGSVATGEVGYEKSRFSIMYRSIDAYYRRRYPASIGSEVLVHLNLRHLSQEPQPLNFQKHAVTKAVAVPKDATKPRIISSEPLLMQFLQQAVARTMMKRIERSTRLINFTNQTVNRELARNYSFSTLDLSNASDSVSRKIVKQLFPDDWFDLLDALRSTAVRVRGRVVPIRTFAPMGSALCFPVESVVFAALAYACTFAGGGEDVASTIRVYGDDIIVPNNYFTSVKSLLSACGFTPNHAKCCSSNSLFRESCGAEWYAGQDVTVVRPQWGAHRTELPMVDFASSCVRAGFPKLAQSIADLVTVPIAIGEGPGYGHPSLQWVNHGNKRWNPLLQRYEVRRAITRAPRLAVREADTWAHLFMHLVAGWSTDTQFTDRVVSAMSWSPVTEEHFALCKGFHDIYGAPRRSVVNRRRR